MNFLRKFIMLFFAINFVLYGQTRQSVVSLDSLQMKIQTLEARIDSLQQKQWEQELLQLRQEAQQGSPSTSETMVKRKTFYQGARSLQKLNPEISLTADGFSLYHPDGASMDLPSGFHLREIGFHFQSSLDPFSISKIIFTLSPEEGIDLEEAYVTWTNPLPRTSITFGKFRQQVGVLNRWHVHALDQTFYPLIIQSLFGEEGLAQTGISLHVLLPRLTAQVNELTFQITMNENEALWGTGTGLPNALLHYKNYFDITEDTYFELGVTGLIGTNDDRGFNLNTPRGTTRIAGVDLTLSWTPAQFQLYKQLDWRSEFYWMDKQELNQDPQKAWGGFSYVQYRTSRRLYAGVRIDYQAPITTPQPLAEIWQVTPYLTWWQSEFVYLRFQYTLQHEVSLQQNNSQFLLQIDWSFGPHKHEKY